MRLLLDSHAFLWWLVDDPRLSRAARQAMLEPATVVYVSTATVWELAVKAALGRLDLGDVDLVEEIAANGFAELPISAVHASAAAALPRHHDDPFDRMLVAQAKLEGLSCVTRDPAFSAYEVAIVW